MSRVALCFGEALIDRFPDRSVVAGAPLHVAVHLARCGWDASLISRVGRDESGERIRRTLEQSAVRVDLIETDAELPTGSVSIDWRDGDHAFTIDRPAAWDAIEGPESLPEHEVFVYGTLAARTPRSRESLRRLLAMPAAATRVFDVNFRRPDVLKEAVQEGLRAANVIKLNEREATELPRVLGFGRSPEDLFEAAPRLHWICTTRGSRGASLLARDGRAWTAPARTVQVVDTVGAGDAFTAGLIDGLARTGSPRHSLEQGLAFAAAIVQRRGGLPG